MIINRCRINSELIFEQQMALINRGYSLQFAQRPPRFSGVVPTLVQSKGAHVLRSEVMALLAKGAGEMGLQPRASQASTAVTSSSPKKMEGYGPSLISEP